MLLKTEAFNAEQFNAEQRAAAHYAGPARHLLVLAGAGTGKTRTLIGRVSHLIRQGAPAERLLLLTFTRRASREMLHRLRSDVGPVADQVTAGTFHHFCLQIMRRIPQAFGLETATIIDRDDAQSLLQLLRGERVEKKRQKEFPKAAQLMNYISYAKNCCLTMADYLHRYTEHDETTTKLITDIAAAYESRKQDRQYLDYDDILHLFVQGLEQRPTLREKVAKLFLHILVDEMQDTNPLQWRILELLSDAQLFCVGDDAQSIYAFRGADFRNVHEFRQRLPNADILKLQENYRSTQSILDIANWLLAQSPLHYDKELHAHRGRGEKPVLIDFETKSDEAYWIAQDLQHRHEGGARWSDHMVLTRSAWSAKAVEGALIDHDIPYKFIGGTSLLEAAHVKDLLSLARCALNKRDELAWMRYLKFWPKIGDVTAAKVVDALLKAEAAADPLPILEATLPKRDDILQGVKLILQYRAEPQIALRVATQHMNGTYANRYDRWESRAADLRLLAELASRYKDLLTFVEAYTLDPVNNTEEDTSETDDAVSLITVHSAKGTEAPVCYCIGVQPGVYPHVRSLGDTNAEEEERRILYVALTRAQNELFITRAGEDSHTVFHGGSYAHSVGSPYFLEYLPPALVEHQVKGYGSSISRGNVFDSLLEGDW